MTIYNFQNIVNIMFLEKLYFIKFLILILITFFLLKYFQHIMFVKLYMMYIKVLEKLVL